MTKRINPLIAKAQEKIGRLADADRRRFSRALKYSVAGNGKEPPKAYDSNEVHELTGVAPHVQLEFHIVVTKKMALEFLEGLNYSPKRAAFKKRVNEKRYKQFFGKDPCRVSNKLVFSYLEIMHMEGISMTIELNSEEKEE